MIEESEIEKILKKYLSNTINSNTNKKIFKNESKIDELMEKTNSIIKLLNNISERIDNIENHIFLNKKICTNNEANNQTNNEISLNYEVITNNEMQRKPSLVKIESNSNIELLKKMNEIISKDLIENNESDTEYNFIEKEDYTKNDEDKNFEKKKISRIKKQKTEEVLVSKYVDIKIRHFDIDDKIIRKYLNMNSTNGDIQLFKKMYIENIAKEYIPIRHIKKKFQYWINDHMKDDDTNGEYIVNVVLKNIELCYMKVNNMDNYGDDIDKFLKNQEHINRLHDIKYKEKILVLIVNLVDI
jgi:hypothetical protein